MDPNTSIGRLCLGENNRVSLNDRIESEIDWDTSKYRGTTKSGRKREIKSFTFSRMETEEVRVEKNGERVVTREVLVLLRGGLYFVSFIINPEEDDVEPGVIFGRSFLRLTKGIVDFGNGILTIYLDLVTFNDVSDEELDAILSSIDISDLPPLDITDIPPFVCNMGKSLRNKSKPSKIYKMRYDGEGPSLIVNQPRNEEELSRKQLE
ncbi:hypothetical protein Tco_1553998 [Tanacetum coccineum]